MVQAIHQATSSKLCVNQLRLSYKGRTEDALAPSADEGRGKHRYASGSRKQAVIRGISEWGNPALVMECYLRTESIGA